MKSKFLIFIVVFTIVMVCSCELDELLQEKPYSTVVRENFFQNKKDVIRATLLPYDLAYRNLRWTFYLEDTGDQIMTPNRQGHWYDQGYYYRLHYHTWTPLDRFTHEIWQNEYRMISAANHAIENLEEIDVLSLGVSETEVKQFIAELRVLRARSHLRLLDVYRNIVISTKYKGADPNPSQSTPQETFDFIEKELKEAVLDLPKKGDPKSTSDQTRWTKAGAMSLLVRLYLNSEVYTGIEKFAECAAISLDIINGLYGDYSIDPRWDGVFDYDNHSSPEVIFAFPSNYGYTAYHLNNVCQIYNRLFPFRAESYFGVHGYIASNFKFALQPGRDVDSVEYPFELGKPLIKFQKFGDDIRDKKYRNLGNSKREGMFLWGYLECSVTGRNIKGTKGYDYYIRDQVGIFNRINEQGQAVPYGPGENHLMTDKRSSMAHADENSGVFPIKYPFYPGSDPNSFECNYVEVRLAEIYYSLAECKFRAGDKAGASELLNAVRQRYYPEGSPSLYSPDGSDLTEMELLDEWGREFLVEGRRRTDLIRFNKFTTGIWWDKTPSDGDHRKIMPIGQRVLGVNANLIQNPGYQ